MSAGTWRAEWERHCCRLFEDSRCQCPVRATADNERAERRWQLSQTALACCLVSHLLALISFVAVARRHVQWRWTRYDAHAPPRLSPFAGGSVVRSSDALLCCACLSSAQALRSSAMVPCAAAATSTWTTRTCPLCRRRVRARRISQSGSRTKQRSQWMLHTSNDSAIATIRLMRSSLPLPRFCISPACFVAPSRVFARCSFRVLCSSRFACEIVVDPSVKGMTVVIPDYPDRDVN